MWYQIPNNIIYHYHENAERDLQAAQTGALETMIYSSNKIMCLDQISYIA